MNAVKITEKMIKLTDKIESLKKKESQTYYDIRGVRESLHQKAQEMLHIGDEIAKAESELRRLLLDITMEKKARNNEKIS